MKAFMEKPEELLGIGGIKKDVVLLAVSGAAVLCSLFGIQPFPFDIAWIAIVLCGLPIILEAVIGGMRCTALSTDLGDLPTVSAISRQVRPSK